MGGVSVSSGSGGDGTMAELHAAATGGDAFLVRVKNLYDAKAAAKAAEESAVKALADLALGRSAQDAQNEAQEALAAAKDVLEKAQVDAISTRAAAEDVLASAKLDAAARCQAAVEESAAILSAAQADAKATRAVADEALAKADDVFAEAQALLLERDTAIASAKAAQREAEDAKVVAQAAEARAKTLAGDFAGKIAALRSIVSKHVDT
jgi:hypothetical protein